MAITASGIVYPDEGTSFNINTILATMASSIESAVGPHIEDTGWTAISVNSGFTAAESLGWRRIGKIIYLRGMVTRAAGVFPAAHEAVFTLPVGARPPIYSRWPLAVYASSLARGAMGTIASDGICYVGGTGDSSDVVRFSNVTFPID